MIFAKLNTAKKVFRSARGFTAVEVLIVIAIVGIMSAIAVTNLLSYMPKSRLNSAARAVACDIMAARMMAVKGNCNAIVKFESGNQYYVIIDENRNNTHDTGERKIMRDLSEDYKDVVNTKADTKNIFNSRGAASRMRNIILRNSSGIRTIRVSITGRVKIN